MYYLVKALPLLSMKYTARGENQVCMVIEAV